ncbi:transposase [Streptomyces acidicola]|uniref:transposase n=1 Tax=Streptomyces acidicola TaxID=2596892 RepID=UPI003F4DD782
MREKRKPLADPILVVLDTQSIHASFGAPPTTTGRDAAKRVPGRKRCLAVDVLGLVIDCVVLPASAYVNTVGIALLGGVTEQCDTVKKALVDQGFKREGRRARQERGHRTSRSSSATRTTRGTHLATRRTRCGEREPAHHPQAPPHSPGALTRHRSGPQFPDHPAYPQILTTLADVGRPMRAPVSGSVTPC